MEGAKKLLASGDDKVESVAASCGYPNINSFFTAFRREVGMTPTEYRRTHSQLK
jgi:AraC-like DNA-binding protein